MEAAADIGLVGLGVMGENLVLNMISHGYTVAVFNRHTDKVDNFLKAHPKESRLLGCHSLRELTEKLKQPRKVFMMVSAGKPVDELIAELDPLLQQDDILIDGGNSHYKDTERRTEQLTHKGLRFIGCGVSGGAEGALRGPSLMPGGNERAWPEVEEILKAVAAKAKEDGLPCCEWLGKGGAGHYVKMVHNGIEYSIMHNIAECYQVMKQLLQIKNEQISDIFREWNEGELGGYLLEISSHIMAKKLTGETQAKEQQSERRNEPGSETKSAGETSEYFVDKILDTAAQSGTGEWTVEAALEAAVPLNSIAEAVFARALTARKDERVKASRVLDGSMIPYDGNADALVGHLRAAMMASNIVAYAQGFELLRSGSEKYGWNLKLSDVAKIWRAGCIIRSKLLLPISDAFDKQHGLMSILLDDYFVQAVQASLAGWRETVIVGAKHGIPMPGIGSALTFYDSYRSAWLPANLVQAQRDYFGAHKYEKIGEERGKLFHTDWSVPSPVGTSE